MGFKLPHFYYLPHCCCKTWLIYPPDADNEIVIGTSVGETTDTFCVDLVCNSIISLNALVLLFICYI